MQQPTNPILIIVRGIPGSGKSYVAAALCHALGEDRVVLLDPDTTDYTSEVYQRHIAAQLAEGVDPTLHAYRYLRAQAYEAIAAHKIIIWNQPFTNHDIFQKMMGRLHTQAAESGTRLAVLIVEVQTDPAVAKERVVQRKAAGGHGPSDATLQRRIDDYETFAEEGYKTISVHGDARVDESAQKILAALNSLVAE